MTLDREARVFTRYLIGAGVTPYVAARYAAAHAALPALSSGTWFDGLTVALARVHPIAAFVLDAATRILAPRGRLRCKLVALLAVLEVSAGTHGRIDQAWGPWPLAFVVLAARAPLFLVSAVGGAVLLAPLRALAAIVPGGR